VVEEHRHLNSGQVLNDFDDFVWENLSEKEKEDKRMHMSTITRPHLVSTVTSLPN